MLIAHCAAAFEIEDHRRFGADNASQTVTILSTADIRFFAPMIESFLATNPAVAVDYTVASSTEVMRAIHAERRPFDLVISSAMDLQTKLANDGFVQRHEPDGAHVMADWAVWNDMVFAFTQEAAAIVLSNKVFEDLAVPRSRQELIALLRENPDLFRGKVGTYDIRQSGLGYLFATQDTRASDTYWRLTEVMGGLDAKLYCCSSDMIDAVEDGTLAVAYNVLQSYAINRQDTGRFTVVLPSDFSTVMLRSVVIPNNAPTVEMARLFLDHMLGQAFGPTGSVALGQSALDQRNEASLHRIRLGPGLLVFLDQLKKRAFLQEWTNAILQP
ncbi:ABC transporter substrate-binding protein [Rhodobacteraceae bacterium SC52]|nr:ABC transporter substrate-binding protein [Rhodobacteraceae bacterium SC52]